MTQLDIARQNVATLETAPTRFVEGNGIRFAYRRLGPATVFPNRCLRPPSAAILHEVVGQPVVRPGFPEAGEGA